jgi:hypothetical protein
MASKRSVRLRTLLDRLETIETTTKAEASGSSGALHARAETPSAPPDNFEDHVCREIAASLFRYRAILPAAFLRDTKVCHPLPCQHSMMVVWVVANHGHGYSGLK